MKNTKSYSELLLDPRWQKKRLEIMQRDNFKCKFCGCSYDTLHVHHLDYSNKPWDIESKYLITLCEGCHGNLHYKGQFTIVDQGILCVVDYILTEPLFITSVLSYIENHKGLWIIEFREDVDPDKIIRLICGLYQFMSGIDSNLKIRYSEGKKYPFSSDADVYSYLSEINKNIINE